LGVIDRCDFSVARHDSFEFAIGVDCLFKGDVTALVQQDIFMVYLVLTGELRTPPIPPIVALALLGPRREEHCKSGIVRAKGRVFVK
jgi:hypothetical protein